MTKTVLVIFLFASSAFAQELSVDAAESACGPAKVQFNVRTNVSDSRQSLMRPDPGKALVYVVEDQKFKVVNDVTTRVGVDGTWVGANLGNSYLSFSVEPGKHHLCADWKSDFVPHGRLVSLTSFTAEQGKIYYFRARISASPTGGKAGAGASIDLDLVDEDEGRLLVASSVLSISQQKK
jgi:hypothetical protein